MDKGAGLLPEIYVLIVTATLRANMGALGRLARVCGAFYGYVCDVYPSVLRAQLMECDCGNVIIPMLSTGIIAPVEHDIRVTHPHIHLVIRLCGWPKALWGKYEPFIDIMCKHITNVIIMCEDTGFKVLHESRSEDRHISKSRMMILSMVQRVFPKFFERVTF